MNLNDVIIYIMAVFAAAGNTTVPVGCIAGGITAGYEMGMILKNLTPILILVLLIIWGLLKKPDWMVKGFSVFGKGITLLITFGLGVGIVQALTGIVLIKKLRLSANALGW